MDVCRFHGIQKHCLDTSDLDGLRALNYSGVLAGANSIARRRSSDHIARLVKRYACKVIRSLEGLAHDLRPKIHMREPPLNRKCARSIIFTFNHVGFLISTDFSFTCLSGRHIPVNHAGREIAARIESGQVPAAKSLRGLRWRESHCSRRFRDHII